MSGTWSVNQFEYDPCLLMFLVFAAVRERGGEDGPVAGEAQSVQTAEARGDPPEVNQPTLQPEGRGDTPEVNQPTLQSRAFRDYVRPCWQMMCIRYVWM